mmetsp:Transcript_4873/g.8867  ORF Transcript_4873/g.8867 Transcript_4873/m.8867 type:complete len:149 (-) Transcript_4873:670-1116(-)
MQLLQRALNLLFTSTTKLSDTALSHPVSGLGSLCLTALANAATAEADPDDMNQMTATISTGTSNPPTSRKAAVRAPRIFAVKQLLATIEANVHRVTRLPKNSNKTDGRGDERDKRESLGDSSDHLNLWEVAMGYLNIMMNHKDQAATA